MSALGYVVIEYNQASHWPALEHATLYDTEAEAREWAERARRETEAVGRRESYAVAYVKLVPAPVEEGTP